MSIKDSPINDKLAYSVSWEDWEVVDRALRVQASDTVVCIVSGGDTVLNLLAGPVVPRHVVGVDHSPDQLALFQLKCAAVRCLDRLGCRAFLGQDPATPGARLAAYAALRGTLPPAAAAWWDDHRDMLEPGAAQVGRLSAWLRSLRQAMHAGRLSDHHDVHGIGGGRDQQKLRHVLSATDPQELVRQRAAAYYAKPPAPGDPFAQGLWGQDAAPVAPEMRWFATDAAYHQVRGSLARVSVVCSELGAFARGTQGVNKWHLSDILEYMDPTHAAELQRELWAASAPGAVGMVWNFVVERLPLLPWWLGADALSLELSLADRVPFYAGVQVWERQSVAPPPLSSL